MDTDSLERLATTELLDRALALARTDEDDDADRWAAVVALRRRPERAVFEQAMRWCASREPRDRCLGANILSQLGAPECPFAAESTPALVTLLRDQDEDVVIEAVYALGHLRAGTVTELAAFARHASSRVREAVAHALGGRADPNADDTLRLLSADGDTDVRNWATFGLGSLCERDTPDIRDALADRLADEDEEVRGEALVGLARRRDPRATAAIVAALNGGDVSPLVIEAAESMPSAEFIGPLRAVLRAAPSEAVLQALARCEAVVDSPAA
jgi:HEAT repeat protein